MQRASATALRQPLRVAGDVRTGKVECELFAEDRHHDEVLVVLGNQNLVLMQDLVHVRAFAEREVCRIDLPTR